MDTVFNSQTVYAVKLSKTYYRGYTNEANAIAHKNHFDGLQWLQAQAEVVVFEAGALKQASDGVSYLPVEQDESSLYCDMFEISDSLRI